MANEYERIQRVKSENWKKQAEKVPTSEEIKKYEAYYKKAAEADAALKPVFEQRFKESLKNLESFNDGVPVQLKLPL